MINKPKTSWRHTDQSCTSWPISVMQTNRCFSLLLFHNERPFLWNHVSSFRFILSTFNCVACVRLQLSSGQKTNTSDQVADQIHLSIPRFLHHYSSAVFVFSNCSVFNLDIWCLVWRGCRGGQGLQPNWYESYTYTGAQTEMCDCTVPKNNLK